MRCSSSGKHFNKLVQWMKDTSSFFGAVLSTQTNASPSCPFQLLRTHSHRIDKFFHPSHQTLQLLNLQTLSDTRYTSNMNWMGGERKRLLKYDSYHWIWLVGGPAWQRSLYASTTERSPVAHARVWKRSRYVSTVTPRSPLASASVWNVLTPRHYSA